MMTHCSCGMVAPHVHLGNFKVCVVEGEGAFLERDGELYYPSDWLRPRVNKEIAIIHLLRGEEAPKEDKGEAK